MKLFERLRWLDTERPTPRNRGRFGKQLRSASDVGRRHAGNEQRDVEKVAAVERQALRFLLRDARRDLAAGGLDHRGISGHRHGVGRARSQLTGRSNAEPTPA